MAFSVLIAAAWLVFLLDPYWITVLVIIGLSLIIGINLVMLRAAFALRRAAATSEKSGQLP